MSWVKMTMKFPGKCTVCGKTVDTGQVGFWARGMGVKHEECSQVAELECMACGAPAGCPLCEFADFCSPSSVSQKCICTKCSNSQDPLLSYLNDFAARVAAVVFPTPGGPTRRMGFIPFFHLENHSTSAARASSFPTICAILSGR